MLHLVSKSRFESACLGKKPDRTVQMEIKDMVWPYFEDPDTNSWILYVSELKRGLVFGNIQEVPCEVDYSDWEITKVSDIPNPKYILNIMKSCKYIDYEFYKTCDKGDWEIRNSRTQEVIEFTIKKCGSEHWSETAIGYPEKLEVPINKTVTKLKDKFIQLIAYGLRTRPAESNIGSESNTQSV